MANIELKSIKFPDLADTYVIHDYTDELADKANIDGSYESMTVGNAEQLVSSIYEEESVPYNFRTSGGSLDIGDREIDEIVGGTVAWNQLVTNGNFASVSTWTTAVSSYTASNNVATVTASSAWGRINQPVSPIKGHKYFVGAFIKPTDSSQQARILWGNSSTGNPIYAKATGSASGWVDLSGIVNASQDDTTTLVIGALATATTFDVKNVQVHDLTQMFGSTIADYIYSLEQGSAGSGVAWFRKLFPKPYYAYNSGELMSVNALSHDMVGFNAWDEEWEVGGINDTTGQSTADSSRIRSKNYIPVIPSTAYYFNVPVNSNVYWYDADKNYISYTTAVVPTALIRTSPSNACFMRFYCGSSYGTTYKGDICINISWDGERNGEYEAYKKNSYPLDDITLRGIPKLDASNNLYYDGDVYEADGTVTRKYGYVDMGTLNWTYNSSNDSFAYNYTDAKMGCRLICSKYAYGGYANNTQMQTVSTGIYNTETGTYIKIKDTNYTTADAFKSAMSGVYLVYELATPTTETAEPYQTPQIVDNWGTEEYVDTRDVKIPVGHNTKYLPDLKAKLETLPNPPTADGEYLVKQTSGVNNYIALASSATIQNIIARLEALEGGNE